MQTYKIYDIVELVTHSKHPLGIVCGFDGPNVVEVLAIETCQHLIRVGERRKWHVDNISLARNRDDHRKD